MVVIPYEDIRPRGEEGACGVPAKKRPHAPCSLSVMTPLLGSHLSEGEETMARRLLLDGDTCLWNIVGDGWEREPVGSAHECCSCGDIMGLSRTKNALLHSPWG